jgi:hypothetical protein
MNIQRITIVVSMIVVAAASTLLPHPPNFTPLAAIALFAGAQLKDRRLAFGITFGTLLLRDAILGFHVLMPVVYACYAVNVCLGFLLREKQHPGRIAAASLFGSVLFFAITNFAVWAAFDTYAHTAQGLSACYVAAIPYFRNTLASDLLYSVLMFGMFAFAKSRLPSLREAASTR